MAQGVLPLTSRMKGKLDRLSPATRDTNLGTRLGEHEAFGTLAHSYANAHADKTYVAADMPVSPVVRIVLTLADQAANLILPAAENKLYIIRNTSGFAITAKVAAQTGIVLANGDVALLCSNGTDIIKADSTILNMAFADDETLTFGTGNDIVIKWDGTDMHMSGAAASSVFNIGAAGNVINIVHNGSITNVCTMVTTGTRPLNFSIVPVPTSLLDKEFAYFRADIDTAYNEAIAGNDGFTVGMFRAYVGANQGGAIIEAVRGGVNLDAGVIISDGAGAGYIAGARFTTYIPATANAKTVYGAIFAPRHDTAVAAIAGSLYTGIQVYLYQQTAQDESRGLDIFTEAGGAVIDMGIDIRGNTKYLTGIHIAQGSIDYCGIAIGEFVASAASGGGFAVTLANSAAMRVYAEVTADLTSAAMVRSILGRMLVTGNFTSTAECFGVVGQLVVKNAKMQHDNAGVMGTLEVQTTAATFSGDIGDTCSAAVLGRVGVTITGTGVEADGVLAGVAAMSNITDGYVTVTSGGVLAGLYVGKFASKQTWDVGLYIGAAASYAFGFASGSNNECGVKLASVTGIPDTTAKGTIRFLIGTTAYYIPFHEAGDLTGE